MKRVRDVVFTPRYLGYLAFAVAFAVACVFLSTWQFDRRQTAVERITNLENNWDAEPIPYDEAVANGSTFVRAQDWLPVELRGQYLTDEQTLATLRPLGGQVGYEQLVPFRTTDGRVVIIDRGWIASFDDRREPTFDAPVPAGEVVIVARLAESEKQLPGRSAAEGQIASIYLPELCAPFGEECVVSGYGRLASESVAVSPMPVLAQRPVLTEGNHLSYAFQWILFGVLGLIAVVLAVRNEYRIRYADDPKQQARRQREAERARTRPRSDAEIEDALLDGQRA